MAATEIIISRESSQPSASRQFPIHDATKLWLVTSGKVDLFLQPPGPEGLPGALSHVLRVEPGEAFFGISVANHPGVSLLACLHPGTVLQPADLDDLSVPQFSPSQQTELLSAWIAKLTLACDGPVAPRDSEQLQLDKMISAGDAPVHVVAGQEVVWVKQLKGWSNFLGQEIRIQEGQILPLARRSAWLQIAPEGCICSITFDELRLQDNDWKHLRDFHAIMLACLLENQRRKEGKGKEDVVRRKQSDALRFERSLLNLAAPLMITESRAREIQHVSDDPLLLACEEIGAAAGITFKPVTNLPPTAEMRHAVEAIARVSGIRCRRVVLQGEWWKQDHGHLLAFLREGGRPVALIHRGRHGYELRDPVQNRTIRFGPEEAGLLDPFAYTFYVPLCLREVNGRDLLLFGFRSTRRELLIVGLMGIAGGLMSMVVPVVTGVIFDNVIPGADRHQLMQLTVLLLTAAIATAMFALVRSLAVLRLEGRMDAAVQAAIWDRLLPFFRSYSSGDLAVRSLAISQIRQILTSSTLSSVLAGIFSIFSFFLLFYYSWRLALLACGLVILVLALSVVCAWIQLRFSREWMRMRGRVSAMLLQFIGGIGKLRISGSEGRAYAAWVQAFAQQKRLFIKSQRAANSVAVIHSVAPILALVVLFRVASTLVSGTGSSAISTGAFLAFLAAFIQVLACAMQFSASISSVLSIIPIYERARPILSSLPEVDEQKANPGELNGGIEVSHVSFRYAAGSPLALRDVSFSIKPGEFVACTGPSGSGKSTLLRLLLGFETPESGSISYDGQDISGVDIQAVRQQIGVVLQSGRVIGGTVQENITGSLPLSQDQIWEAIRLAGLEQDVKALPMGIHTYVSEGGGGFSGGQRQRLMIARAIIKRPRILFFDEATSALDNQTQAIVSRSLESLQATRVVIAHRLSTIMHADRILVFDRGAIVQSGSYEELMKQPGIFRELVKRQVV
jgi:NHLM bacteriocin system ABC transporter ATP-binding protein